MLASILLVDDEADVVDVERDLLECLGYKVSATTSSREAVSRFARNPDSYSLVITDYNMPELNGLELTSQLKHLSPQTPVVLISGYLNLNGEAARLAGVDAAMTKPVQLKELGNVVKMTLELSRSGQPH